MARHSYKWLLLACVLIGNACGVDTSVDPVLAPPPPPSPAPEPEVITAFRLYPDSVPLEEGAQLQLLLEIRNQRGVRPDVFPAITYSSSKPDVVDVSYSGYVRAISPGTAVVSAQTTVAGVTFSSRVTLFVRQAVVFDSLVLKAEDDGWEPTPAHVVAGGKVEWRPGLIATAGVPVHTLYVWEYSKPSTWEEIDLTKGSVTRTFARPGVYQYCSNACWDPPEHGTIIVH